MQIYKQIDNITSELNEAVVTIGNFDGIHIGHQYIMKKVVSEAHRGNNKAIVITFDPHPKMVLHPYIKPFYLITTLKEKLNLLEELGIDTVILFEFTKEFAKITAEYFVNDMLWNKLHIKKIFIGHNYTFGNDKQGNEVFLKKFGSKLGFEVEVINAIKVNDIEVSSTRIREAILEGDVKKAAIFLGRPYNLRGVIVIGHQRGVGLGFPTANIDPEKVLIPLKGVYAVNAELDNKTYNGVLNIGYNPTFGDDKLSIELHIIDFNSDIYEMNINVLFVERLRDEIKFAGPDVLIAQIKQDIQQAKNILSGRL